ncbi:MAG: ComF family protein [Cetobacterium somerae]|uniref:ComF family protein n=1 Tax=Cetobacterium TaxID=180162 RepID=UPI00163CD723|nr:MULTISPECIES: phosphoribosyltransferase family protein [Cetobacterium]MBC2854077.1 ComF family protein [Cetobacterium sp. 2G large]MCQ9627694.1 ComF family protein [Cetobacterium somerae]
MSDLKQRENLYYLYYYTDVKKIIFDLKFKNRKGVANSLSRYVKESIEQIQIKEEIDVVISVPVNKKRFLERGYNQVDEILKSADIKFENIERIKNTKHMYEIKEHEKRKENVKKAFKVTRDYFQKNILIVDDIVTTGATIKEIEKEFLENQKAKSVVFFTIAVVRDYFK